MTLVKQHLGVEVEKTPGSKGQFDLRVDGETIVRRGGNFLTRSFGMGYPGLEEAVETLRVHLEGSQAR